MGSVLLFIALLGAFGTRAAAGSDKPVIAVAPIGGPPREAIEALLPELRRAFASEVVIAPPINIPPTAFERSRGQYLSTALLDLLAAAKRPEWDRLLGVADVDLYVPELNFVFGEGDSRRGVAVFSLARLRPAAGDPERSEALFRRRAATEAIHELGHAYGLSHCRRADCVMWFSNTLAESDRKGTRFCPEHARELTGARR